MNLINPTVYGCNVYYLDMIPFAVINGRHGENVSFSTKFQLPSWQEPEINKLTGNLSRGIIGFLVN